MKPVEISNINVLLLNISSKFI